MGLPQKAGDDAARAMVDAVYRSDSRRVLATLIRLLGDFDRAEEAMHDAFVAAVEQWPRQGVPANPRAWLISAGRFKAIDGMRRRARFDATLTELEHHLDGVTNDPAEWNDESIEDDRLRLIFTCCHPALPPDAQIALTLREVCGLTTEEIARSFLTAAPTIAKRIVRAKGKIRDARIPYEVPSETDLPERLDTVLHVIYLLFTEGYSASSGGSLTRADISLEASLARDALDKVTTYFGSAPFSHYTAVIEYLKPLPPPHEYNFSMEHLDSGTFFLDIDHIITASSPASQKESNRFNYAHHIAHSWIPKRCYGAGYIPFNWEMTPVIDTIWFNEGFGRYAAIAALADALPKEEAAKYRTARLDRLRSIVASAPDFLQRMSLDELSREGSFLYGDDFRVGMNLFSRGALMAAEMDDRIRAQTSNQESLRDALRYLMAWTAKNRRAFRTDELPEIFRQATGVDTTSILKSWMQPTRPATTNSSPLH